MVSFCQGNLARASTADRGARASPTALSGWEETSGENVVGDHQCGDVTFSFAIDPPLPLPQPRHLLVLKAALAKSQGQVAWLVSLIAAFPA